MKDPKFRVWDKLTSKMSPSFSLFGEFTLIGGVHAWQHEESFALGINDHFDSLGRLNDLEIMQFTGLEDKNGTSIFEGDIVEFVGGTCSFLPCGNYLESHKIGTILVVQYLKSGYTLRLENHLDNGIPNLVCNVHQYTFWNHARSLKVIGNIHEHKHLLV